jgi:hypothetical protein
LRQDPADRFLGEVDVQHDYQLLRESRIVGHLPMLNAAGALRYVEPPVAHPGISAARDPRVAYSCDVMTARE